MQDEAVAVIDTAEMHAVQTHVGAKELGTKIYTHCPRFSGRPSEKTKGIVQKMFMIPMNKSE